jgi:hypothetical protein
LKKARILIDATGTSIGGGYTYLVQRGSERVEQFALEHTVEGLAALFESVLSEG